MPRAALRPCTYPRCNTLVSGGRCDLHSLKNVKRDPAVKRLYNSKQWLSIRVTQLSSYPWCADCLKKNNYIPATEVDHIERHNGDPIKFFKGPFQSLCTSCHSRKTVNEIFH